MDTKSNLEFLRFQHLKSKDFLPSHLRAEFELNQLYTDFILCYLVKSKKGKATFDESVLKINDLNKITYQKFYESQKAIDWKYVNVLNQTENSMTLELTEFGLNMYYQETQKYKIKLASFIYRLLYKSKKKMASLIDKIKDCIYYIDDILSSFIDSGFGKLILFLIALLTFIFSYFYNL